MVGGKGDISGYDYCFEITAGAQCDEARVRARVRVIAGSSCDMRCMNSLWQLGRFDALCCTVICISFIVIIR